MRITIPCPALTSDSPLVPGAIQGPCLVAHDDTPESGMYVWVAGPRPTADRSSALLIATVTMTQLQQLASGDRWSLLPRLAQVRIAYALSRDGVRSTEIAALLGHPNKPEVWRWAALADASPALRDAVLEGALSPGHLRPLLSMPPSRQTEWATRARRGRWSVRQLTAAIRAENAPAPALSSADIQSLENVLAERLGTGVKLHWSDNPSQGHSLSIDWCDIESLKGVLERLAAGPEALPSRPVIPRKLTIPLANADELAAVTDHLIGH